MVIDLHNEASLTVKQYDHMDPDQERRKKVKKTQVGNNDEC